MCLIFRCDVPNFPVQIEYYKYFAALHHLSVAHVNEMIRSESSIAAVIFVEVKLRISRERCGAPEY